MTIYQQSFKPLSFIASAPSLDSLCTNTDISSSSCYQNTTTDCEESLSLLSLPSDEDEEQDWRDFGYLLDSNSLVSFKGQSFIRSNSMPEAQPDKLKGLESESNFSSLDVQVCSSRSGSSSTQSCCSGDKQEEEEPVARRTRNSLAKRETLSEGLDRLSDLPKQDMILNFLCSSQQQQKMNKNKGEEKSAVKWHNVCRPWWHNKIFPDSNENTVTDPWEFKSEEEDEENRAVRKPKEFADEMCDPRLISLGGNTSEKEIKMDSTNSSFSSSEAKVLTARNQLHGTEIKTEPAMPKHFEERKTKRRLSKTEVEEPTARGSPKKRTRLNSTAKKSPSKKSSSTKRQQKVIQDEAEEENREKPCLCGLLCGPGDHKKFSVSCSNCQSHFHAKCVGMTEKKARKLSTKWTCPECEAEEKSEELYCVCRQPYDETKFYVGCDSCSDWYHPACIGTTQE